jgi:hypothetical protein
LHVLESFFEFVTYVVTGNNLAKEHAHKDTEYLLNVLKTQISSSYQIICVEVSIKDLRKEDAVCYHYNNY